MRNLKNATQVFNASTSSLMPTKLKEAIEQVHESLTFITKNSETPQVSFIDVKDRC